MKICLNSKRLLVTSSMVAMAAMVPSNLHAQDQQGGPENADDDQIIVVTGSRISVSNAQTANPVTSFDRETLEQSGRINLTDILRDNPALVGSQDSNDNAGSNAAIGTTGLNLLDLRNLGTARTLVLVDGRRHVAAVPGTAAVDINTIPVDLLERVDILTGGASAVYGADGVSGVVNFIMRKDFEGIRVRGQAGISEQGDAGQQLISVTAGTNFDEDRGNIAINYEFSNEDRLDSQNRASFRFPERVTFARNPAEIGGDDPNVPDRIPLNAISFFDSAREGGIDVDFDGIPDFLPDGSEFNDGVFVPNFFHQNGSGTPQADFIGDLLPRNRRHAVNALFNYELTPSINLFAQAKYVRNEAFTISQPSFDFFLLIEEDNPFLPAFAQPLAVPNGGVLVNRDNFDIGSRGEDITRETIRGVIGFDGDITDNARFEISYTYGELEQTNRQLSNRFNDRFLAALDVVIDPATMQPTCRSNLDPTAAPNQPFASNPFPGFLSFTPGPNSGCVPLNLFGEGAPSQEAIDFITTTSIARSRLEQHVASGFVSGDFGALFKLPGGAPKFVLGAEYREEKSRSIPAQEDTLGATFGNVLFPSFGQYDVIEGFAELSLPILSDLPFADELTVGGAIRFSDYSTVGTTTTWKFDAVWAPIPDIKFRGTIAEAVRAPNIAELFNPANQRFEFITDPCDSGELANGTATRAANCATLLGGLGVADPANFNDTNSFSLAGTGSGNADLQEETAETITLGAVIQPSFIPGLTITVDWYDIELTNAINQVDAQELADLCVDQPSLANPFCASIIRQNGGANAGLITGFTVQPLNVASFTTSGIDFEVNYAFAPGNLGDFNLRVAGGFLDELEFIGIPGADPIDQREQSGAAANSPTAPKWVVSGDLTWKKGDFTVNYGINYFSSTLRFTRQLTDAQPDIAAPEFIRVKERWEHDIRFSLDVNEEFTFYAGVNNLWDQKPDIGQTFLPVSAVGRYFFAGFTTNLQDLFGL